MNDSNLTFDNEAALRDRASRALHIGFFVAAGLIGLGVIVSAIQGDGWPETLGTPLDVLRGARKGDGASIVGVGILAMILTPFSTAAVVGWSFLQEGDRRYAAISGCVLVILLVSMVVALL